MDHQNDLAEFDKVQTALRQRLPKELWTILDQREAGWQLAEKLPLTYPPIDVATKEEVRRTWELVGLSFKMQNRYYEALDVFRRLYFALNAYQEETSHRIHKGMPLVWLSDCHYQLQHRTVGKRLLMLTLIEDAIQDKGVVDAQNTGSYFRAVWMAGIGHDLYQRYAAKAWELYLSNVDLGRFPEFILQSIGQDWLSEYPAREEVGVSEINPYYVRFLLKKIGGRAHG